MPDILFYSTHNAHCDKVISFITKNDLHSNESIQFISLDTRRMVNKCLSAVLPNNTTYTIPPCVNSVPAILSSPDPKTNTKMCLTGSSSIIAYLEEKYNLQKSQKENRELDSYSTVGYSDTSAFSAGFTADITIDPVLPRKEESASLDQIRQERFKDVQMDNGGMGIGMGGMGIGGMGHF
jgi:hypothetical protein